MMTTERQLFVGGYVTRRVKSALVERAAKEGVSVSRLIYRILLQHLHVPESEKR